MQLNKQNRILSFSMSSSDNLGAYSILLTKEDINYTSKG